jgi:uncharacterized damage-inducible protein DinB
MQSGDTLTTLFSHNLWANLRLLEVCAKLSSEQLNASASGTYGSIHNILQHIATGERSYLSRISTGKPYRRPEGAPQMPIEELIDSLRASGQGLIEWAAKVRPADTVQVDRDGEPRDVPKTIILTQAIAHAAEHREQIKVILTQLGIRPPDLQGWAYFDENF